MDQLPRTGVRADVIHFNTNRSLFKISRIEWALPFVYGETGRSKPDADMHGVIRSSEDVILMAFLCLSGANG
jgi:hypothetical protein